MVEISAPLGAAVPADGVPIEDLARLDEPQYEICDGVVRLRGSVSLSSGTAAFPAREVCLSTGARDMVPMTFGPFGRLYSYTTVHVSSSRPTPYTIGYVDFENGVRVLAEVRAGSNGLPDCDDEVEVRAEDETWFVVPREVAV